MSAGRVSRTFLRDHRWSQARLSHHLEDDLPARARARLQRHLAACPDRRRGVLALRALVEQLRAQPVAMPERPIVRFRAAAAGDADADAP